MAHAAILASQKVDFDPDSTIPHAHFAIKNEWLRALYIAAFQQQLLHGPATHFSQPTVVKREVDVHAAYVRLLGRWAQALPESTGIPGG